ncbi:MAG: hypothetical protein QNJ20_00370 [Paracoccaceae bacterium]|nr:hypothetical protein [Paracoccaceae bacterium]
MRLKSIIMLFLSAIFWIASVVAWFVAMRGVEELAALPPNAANADIYPGETKLVIAYPLGIFCSLIAIITGYFAGRSKAANISK